MSSRVTHIYTDGCHLPELGAGGWAAIIKGREPMGGTLRATNSQDSEIAAVIGALEAIEPHPRRALVFMIDHQTVREVVQGVAQARREGVSPRYDTQHAIWGKLMEALAKHPHISADWVKGDRGSKSSNEHVEAHTLAKKMARKEMAAIMKQARTSQQPEALEHPPALERWRQEEAPQEWARRNALINEAIERSRSKGLQ